jgi:hypothetical protein
VTEFLDKLNGPQRETIERLRLTLFWSKSTDVKVRKDGQDHWFEADWLRHALDVLCGPHPEIERRVQEAIKLNTGNTGPETAARQRGPQ